jgi:uncharacterized protein (TIGR00730 family)
MENSSKYSEEINTLSNVSKDIENSNLYLKNINNIVTILGSTKYDQYNEYYKNVTKLTDRLAEQNINIITSGYGGIMTAANKGCQEAFNPESQSITINSSLCSQPQSRKNHFSDIKINHKHIVSQKIDLIRHSFAFICCKGGLDTFDELFEIARLINIGQLNCPPIVLFDRKFYEPLIGWIKDVLCDNNILTLKEIDKIFVIADSWEDASDIILSYYSESMT